MFDKIICPFISKSDNIVECMDNCALKVSFDGKESQCAFTKISSDIDDLNRHGLDVFNRER